MNPFVVAVLPSRGLISAKTLDSVTQQATNVLCSWEESIPDCFNVLVIKACKKFPQLTHIWIVEEDVVPPLNALDLLLQRKEDVVAFDYPLRHKGSRSYYRRNETVFWAATGCMLIKRKVLEVIPYPWFISDKGVQWEFIGSAAKMWEEKLVDKEPGYGGHDIVFGFLARHHGFSLEVLSQKEKDPYTPTLVDNLAEHLNLHETYAYY